MTVESERAARENRMKYEMIRKVLVEHTPEKLMVMGNVNVHIRILGERMNQNSEMVNEFVYDMTLENLNETLAEGRITWRAREQESAIDCVLVNGKIRESVLRMWIDEDGIIDAVFDHNMLVVECMFNGKGKEKVRKSNWKWRLTTRVGGFSSGPE